MPRQHAGVHGFHQINEIPNLALWERLNSEKMVPSCYANLCRLRPGETMAPDPPAPTPKVLSSVLTRKLLGPLSCDSLHLRRGECSPANESVCWLYKRASGPPAALHSTWMGRVLTDFHFPAQNPWAGEPGVGSGGPSLFREDLCHSGVLPGFHPLSVVLESACLRVSVPPSSLHVASSLSGFSGPVQLVFR